MFPLSKHGVRDASLFSNENDRSVRQTYGQTNFLANAQTNNVSCSADTISHNHRLDLPLLVCLNPLASSATARNQKNVSSVNGPRRNGLPPAAPVRAPPHARQIQKEYTESSTDTGPGTTLIHHRVLTIASDRSDRET